MIYQTCGLDKKSRILLIRLFWWRRGESFLNFAKHYIENKSVLCKILRSPHKNNSLDCFCCCVRLSLIKINKKRGTIKMAPLSLVEARGVEPLSKNQFLPTSPSAVSLLAFPHHNAEWQALWISIRLSWQGRETHLLTFTANRRPKSAAVLWCRTAA